MASIRKIAVSGFGRAEEAAFRSLFEAANRQAGGGFVLCAEAECEALIIDADSIYGQMGLMQAQGSGKLLIALTSGSRADADYKLDRPLEQASLARLLTALGNGELPQQAAAPARVEPVSQEPARSALLAAASAPPAPRPESKPKLPPRPAASTPAAPQAVAAPVSAPPRAEPAATTATTTARPRSLFEHLQPGVLTRAVKFQRGDAPALVLEPEARVYLGGSTLKPYIEYLKAPIADEDFKPVSATELAALEAVEGSRQPVMRLIWLAALHAGDGQLIGFDPITRFKLGKWPQIEREFPKHFRIATVMMKQAATVDDIAAASGASREEVCDLLNAYLATGFAEPEQGQASAAAETARSGLMDRLRGLRG
jgi:hypothetical protein